jgi:hypothetical protein
MFQHKEFWMDLSESDVLNDYAREQLKRFAYKCLHGEEKRLVLDISHYHRFIEGLPPIVWPSFLEYRVLKIENPGFTCNRAIVESWNRTLIKRDLPTIHEAVEESWNRQTMGF